MLLIHLPGDYCAGSSLFVVQTKLHRLRPWSVVRWNAVQLDNLSCHWPHPRHATKWCSVI